MNDFGVAILTYPGDYHLSQVLIKSLEFFNPDIDIAIIPGTGFNRDDHPFKGYNVIVPPKALARYYPNYYDRKFWAFCSGFENFLYCDADIICLSPFVDSLEKRIPSEDRFVLANLPSEFYGKLESGLDDRKKKIDSGGQLGILNSISKFDPGYDYYQNYLINSGLFLSSNTTFSIDELIDFRKQEIEFYDRVLSKEFDSASLYDLFYGDQGRINYLVWKHNIKLDRLYPAAHYQWGGKPLTLKPDEMLKGNLDIPFVHWAGCPKPSYSIFNSGQLFQLLIGAYGNLGYDSRDQKRVPCQNLWEHFDDEKSLSRIWNDSTKEFIKYIYPYLKGKIKRML